MTGISEILTKYGATLPQDKQAEFLKEFAANYKSVAEVSKIEAARDNYKAQFETAQTSLKGFEGVDVNDLKKQIGDLQTKLAGAEKDYKAKLDEAPHVSRRFFCKTEPLFSVKRSRST